MSKHLTLSLVFFALFFQGITQWYWQYPIPQGNQINDMHIQDSSGFAVGTNGSILMTDDKGFNWTLMDSVTVNELTSVYIGQQLYAHAVGDYGTILQMTNGLDWNLMNSGTHYKLNGVASTPSAAKTFTVGYKGLILKTEMNWDEWHKITSPTLNILYAIDFATEQIGIIVGDSGIILRTVDNGESWNQVSSGTMQALYDIHFPSETIGYLVGAQGTILKTTDAGATWTNISNNVGAENNLTSVYFGDDTSGCIVGTFGLVITTLDGGDDWDYFLTDSDLPLFATHYYKVPIDTICDTVIVAGTNGQILRTDSCGYSWTNTTHSSSYNLNDIQFLENNFAFAVGGDPYNDVPYMLWFNDTIWQEYKADTIVHYLTEIFFLNQDVGYISGREGSIYKTFDSGISWVPLESGINETLYSIFFLNNLLGFAAGENGTVIKTISGDTTWGVLNSGTTNNLYAIDFSPSTNEGYAVGEAGTILRIKSGGNEIYPVTSGTTEPLFDIFIKSDTVAFAVGFNGTILKIRTIFGYEEVILIASGITTPLNDVFFTNDLTGFIAGDRGVMLKTTNRGSTWYPQYIGTNNNLQSLTFTNAETGYVAGSGVSILKTTNGGGGVILPFITETKTSDYDIQIYPNPVSSITWIAYELSEKADVQISLFDLSGREIKKILASNQLQGKQKVKLDAASIQPGIYLVVLKVNDQLTSEKLIIY